MRNATAACIRATQGLQRAGIGSETLGTDLLSEDEQKMLDECRQ